MMLTEEQAREAHGLIEKLHALYGELDKNFDDVEKRRELWAKVRDAQQRLTAILPPATEPLT